MLEELLKYDRLGNKDELLFLLFKALPLSKSQKVSDLRKYCISNHFSIGKSFNGAVKLLEFLEFINITDNLVSINDTLFDPTKIARQDTYFEQSDIVRILFLSLIREKAISNFISPFAIKQDCERGVFYVKNSLIPFKFFGIRNLLISVGFFGRDLRFGSSNLFVSENFTELFESLVVNLLREENLCQKRRKSLLGLKTQLNNQEAMGKEAEIFVLNFEQQRLQGHPSIARIKRISEDYVNAGFDLESFNDKESVFIDRFIEVKSYSSNVVFYWSQNEVEVAKELAEKYFLYLVDRNKMPESGYAPRVFQDPYQKIFKNELWEKEPETWRVFPTGEFDSHISTITIASQNSCLIGDVEHP